MSLLASLGYALSACRPDAPREPDAPGPQPRPSPDIPPDIPSDIPTEPISTDDLLLFRPDADRYPELSTRFNLRVPQRPAAIVLCRNTTDVATAVLYAQQEGLPVAVKSGGHSFEGFSSNDGGLVVDLSLLDQVEWIDDTTFRVGPACTLAELYDALLPRGRIIPAGSCGSVGLGGLTLGGGYGLFSRKLGLTCDSLIGVTLVDGAGVVRDSRSDPELLWACKGGGNGNFGAVTELRFRSHAAPRGLFSHRFKAYQLEPARAVRLMETWFSIAPTLPKSAYSAFVLNGRTLTILITDTRNDDPALATALDRLSDVMDKTSRGRRQDLATAVKRYYGIQHPIHFKNASAGLYDGFDDLRAVALPIAEIVGGSARLILQVNTLGGIIAHPQFDKASAFPHRSAPFLGELQAYYDRPEQAERYLTAFRKVQGLLAGNGVTRHYRNYPDLDFTDSEQAYYGDRTSRLRQIKRRLDPENVFRHPQSIRGA